MKVVAHILFLINIKKILILIMKMLIIIMILMLIEYYYAEKVTMNILLDIIIQMKWILYHYN